MSGSVESQKSTGPDGDLGTAPYRMTPWEIATGWLTGGPQYVVLPRAGRPRSPVRALEDAIRPALLRPPCVVEFSGGRDSSVVLAVAHRLAQREGLEPPLPFTHRYPGLVEADEDEWQEMVIAHLGITEWERHDATAGADLIGADAAPSLLRWGVLWPPMAHTRTTVLTGARGGSLLSGEGGDEVLGPRRLSTLRQVLGRTQPASRASARQVAFALAPRSARVARLQQRVAATTGLTWLRAEARQEFEHALAVDAAAEPLDWRAAVRQHPSTRAVHLGMHTMEVLATEAGVTRIHPLLSEGFIASLCRAGGPFGFTDRTAALQHLFAELLPAPVLARTSKCRFNRAVFGQRSRAFAERWTGAGVDTELVDADALREIWSGPEPHALTFALFQSCWLATEGALAHG
jgi:Asparagine synthase